MRSPLDFYNTLHSEEKTYSGASYRMDSLWSSRPFVRWIAEIKTKPLRVLDVGCGKGIFLRDFINGLNSNWNIRPSRVTGLDIVRSPGDIFAEISPKIEFVQADTDGNPLPFSDNNFDFISCNHVLEHVFETEQTVREFRRVINPGGLCIIAVPNIAAWVNRIGFLFGNQPLGTEIGTEKVTYGFRPPFLQKRLEKFRPAGHIRDFTPRGLQDLTEHCGFQTLGWWKQSFGVTARLGKWAGRNMAIILRPAK